jgi:Tol biopolymer transport system component
MSGPVNLLGKTISHYRIVEHLGGGGMGVVYRAEDSKLGRGVALKFLPHELSQDPQALERFRREARAASALNHPNICTIHDIDSGVLLGDGSNPEDPPVYFIVMELLEGQTLKHRIAPGAFQIRDLLDSAIQIADALDAAHAQGIIHRDIKPANLFVTKRNQIKIMDFGLAKLMHQPEGPDSGVSALQTSPPDALTAAGMTVGTVAYMSPEQARAQELDARTDLFSFGVVLYEMATGRQAFSGSSNAVIFDAILNRDPVSPLQLNPILPPQLEQIISKALEKDRDIRCQTAAELRADLKRLKRDLDSGKSTSVASAGTTAATGAPALSSVSTSPSTTATVQTPASSSRAGLWIVIAALLAASTTGILLWKRGAKEALPQPPAASSLVQPAFQQLTDDPGVEDSSTISPDAKTVAYQSGPYGNRDIFLLRVGGKNPVNLTRGFDGDDVEPSFSPDGEQIAFRSARDGGGIFLMGATGESVRRLTDFGYNPAWSPDGKEIVFATEGVVDPLGRPTTSQIWIINVASGEKRLLYKGDAVQPQWSPHGSRIAFWSVTGQGGQRDIWTISTGGGQPIQLTTSPAVDWDPVWSPDGKYIFFSTDRGGSMNLCRVPVDEQSGTPLGEPEPVTTPSRWSGFIGISQDGKHLLYTALDQRSNIVKLAFDPQTETVSGALTPVTQGSTVFIQPTASPDGQRVTFRSGGKQEDIYVCRSDGTDLRKLTDDPFRDRGPTWSPDGKRIVFYSDRSGRYDFWEINADGSGLQQVTRVSGRSLWYPRYSADGSRLLGFNDTGTTIFDLHGTLPLEKGIVLTSPGEKIGFEATSWSPDGKRLAGLSALMSDNSSLPGMLIYSFDTKKYTTFGGATPVQRQSPILDVVLWMNDNRRLMMMNGGHISVVDSKSGKDHQIYNQNDLNWLSLSQDNRWIYLVQSADEADIWLATLK